ncbi:hypothetical protein FDUTEX481_02877 [Tolypothrix sp. PCC 7601]|nr:hypothetical protein FDUTEX481_02877 [Tolypothrix sp. PCC 7601]
MFVIFPPATLLFLSPQSPSPVPSPQSPVPIPNPQSPDKVRS